MAKLQAPVMLVILDGFGMGDQTDTTNAVASYNITSFRSCSRFARRANG